MAGSLRTVCQCMRMTMIEVTKLNGKKITINAELIEMIEETPDTMVSFVTGKKIIVKESRQEVKNLVILYKKDISIRWENQ